MLQMLIMTSLAMSHIQKFKFMKIESDRLMLEDLMNKVSSINNVNNTKEYYYVNTVIKRVAWL